VVLPSVRDPRLRVAGSAVGITTCDPRFPLAENKDLV
jgi:hypothetical protein